MARGGSNYNFYQLDGCNREPYGVVNSFNKAHRTIRLQLASMARNGQQRLRIGIFHRSGPDTGTVMDSTGGDLSSQNHQNLTHLLAAVKHAGFVEIEIAFHPEGANNPGGWQSWNEDLYQENWNLIYHLHPIIANANIYYRIDLMNEGTPAPSQPVLAQYAKRLWTDYNYVFGKNDTVGFSIIGNQVDRLNSLKAIYGNNPPYLFDFHFYGLGQDGEYQDFVNAHQKMNEMSYKDQGWIIGEAYYNDALAAENLHRAISDTGRTVFYLVQWPLTRSQSCQDVDVAPPKDFSSYIAKGF